MVNILLSLFASFVIMLAVWQAFDPRFLIIFAISLMVSETFVTIRWRVTLPCPHCGFDPVLYLKKPEKACAKVQAHIDRRRQQPNFYLSGKNPLQHLAHRPPPSVKDELMDRLQQQQDRVEISSGVKPMELTDSDSQRDADLI